ncbi:MAG: hypothetical protein IH851_03290 [Armatimonadetes bacterium]|nr:hypothetical protein [Armatimonadota bacterium]
MKLTLACVACCSLATCLGGSVVEPSLNGDQAAQTKKPELVVIREVEGHALPWPVPIPACAVLTRVSYNPEVDPVGEFFIVMKTDDPRSALWFYEGVFWNRKSSRRGFMPGLRSGPDMDSFKESKLNDGSHYVVEHRLMEDWRVYVIAYRLSKDLEDEDAPTPTYMTVTFHKTSPDGGRE